MKIEKLSFENFRGFVGKHEIEFNNSVTAIIGVNGAGKTSVLDAVKILLSHIIEFDPGSWISFEDKFNSFVNVGENEARIIGDFNGNEVKVQLRGNTSRFLATKENSKLITKFMNGFHSKRKMPTLLYFQTNRKFLEIGLQGNVLNPILNWRDIYKNVFESGINYNHILSWYMEQINIENNEKVKRKDLDYQLPTVVAIRKAINGFLEKIGDFSMSNVHVDVNPLTNNRALFIEKNNQKLEFSQLSSGEKMMIGMVLDIAYRMSIANPMLNNPLESPGIILIDELELHLHPKWQSTVLNALSSTFPKVQFIVTTHSPLVINHLNSNQLVILDDFKITQGKDVYNTYGRDVNSIIEDFMGGQDRPLKIKKIISEIENLIENDVQGAEKKLKELKSLIDPNDYKILELETIIEIEKDETN